MANANSMNATSGLATTRCPIKITDHLYNDFFVRESHHLQTKQKHFSEERKHRLTTKSNHKSTLILANKIAIKTKGAFEKVIQNSKKLKSEAVKA